MGQPTILGTWCENTAEQQTQHSCVLETPSDPCYLKREWKRHRQAADISSSSSAAQRLCRKWKESTFGGDVIANGNHHYTFINEWNSHESRLLLAVEAQSDNMKDLKDKSQSAMCNAEKSTRPVPEKLPVASM